MAQGELIKQLIANRDLILGFIFALTRSMDLAEEIFQDVAMAIVEEDRRGTTVSHFLPWAREVSRRRVAGFFRKRARREALEQPSESLVEVIAQSFTENEVALETHRLRLQALVECVQQLAGRSQQLIEGFYGRRMSLRDLALALTWQENSVKVALSRARKVLADCVTTRLRMQEGA
jgi:RNA polymerase sigma factor (sigma-70 family)